VNIDIQDAALEARMQKQLQATGFGSVRGRIGPQEEQDRSPLELRSDRQKITRGIDQLDRREGIPEDQIPYMCKVS
jgi:hypothetical protein